MSGPCCVWFCLSCLLRLRKRAWDAPATEVADDVEQSFQDEALAPAPRLRGRGSSGRGVVSGWICFRHDFRNGFVGLILCYFDC